MGKPKPLIMYCAKGLGQIRCFSSIPEREEVKQIIVGPPPGCSNGVTYGYENCDIKNIITYTTKERLCEIIRTHSPNVYVTSSFAKFEPKFPLSGGYKKVFIHHGMSNVITSKISKAQPNKKIIRANIKTFDLFCGQGEHFKNYLTNKSIRIPENKIISDALPQFDLLFDCDFKKYRDIILSKVTNAQDKKVILYAGFGAYDTPNCIGHNKEYLDVLFEIERIAKKYNFLILFKSRRPVQKVISFFRSRTRMPEVTDIGKYRNKFSEIINGDNIITFVKAFPIQYLFFADVVIINGYSTIEIEASLAKRPLINVCLVKNSMINGTFGSVQSGAAAGVKEISDLEKTIMSAIYDEEFIKEMRDKQEAYTNDLGIVFDGKAGQRVSDAIVKLAMGK